MPEHDDIAATVSAIRSASASTEDMFLHVGQALEVSTDLLSLLAAEFETAMVELKDKNLSEAFKTLGRAANHIGGFGADQSAANTGLHDMQRLAEAIAERISKMKESVEGVGALAVNAKIAAASIRSSTIDFGAFAGEIARTLAMTRSSLGSFDSELQALRTEVGSAYAGQLRFENDQHAATHSISTSLNATVRAMPSQNRRNAQGISVLRQRNEYIRQQVRSAITALQAGDMTRQRLEHADSALVLLAGDHGLTASERQAFGITTYALQSAQLSAAAQEFEYNVRQITTSLGSIADEARQLHSLADSTFGSTEHTNGTFIGDLESQVGAALSLFEGYRTARADAALTMTGASAAVEGLCAHLRAVQSLEDDIRIMGLNTTLQCARIGPSGRALGLIAQELRTYGNQFAREASLLIEEVESLARIANAFRSAEQESAVLVATLMQAMEKSLGEIRQVSRTIDNTQSMLERDSNRVVALLDESAANIVANDKISKGLRRAAADLEALAPLYAIPAAVDLPPRVQQMLDTIASSYTMAPERVIHDRMMGRPAQIPLADEAAEQELEDFLF